MKFFFLFSLFLLLASGCGYGDRPPLASTRGTVTFNGQPLSGGFIVFRPEHGRSSSSGIDAQGRYDLIYVGDVRGAMLGTHTVYVLSATDENPQERLPAKYNTASELRVEVKRGSNVLDFNLESS